MSLLQDAMEACILIDKASGVDSYGSFTRAYTEGAEFLCAIVYDSSIQARVANVQGVTSLYTVTTPRAVVLEYHDLFKRKRDGKIFRVTSDGDDKATPSSTFLDMRQVTAEEYVLNATIQPGQQGGA